MTDTVRELVDAMVKGDALGTEKTFGAAMAEKLSVKLDDMRTNVAQTMFITQEELDLDPVEDTVDEEDEFDLVEGFISEEEYNSLTEEDQEDYISEEQLDELMGKGSLAKIKAAHDAASSGRSSPVQKFHATQSGRAYHIASKQANREKYGKDSQHHHEYGYDSKTAKSQYAKLGKAGKAKVTKNLGKEYAGKDHAPGKLTKGKTTIHNPETKAQRDDHAARRTAFRKSVGLPQLDIDK